MGPALTQLGEALMLVTAQLGMPYGRTNMTGQPDDNEAFQLIQSAIDQGVQWFDCARAYGVAEQRLGHALKKLGLSDAVHVVTKLDPLADLTPNDSPTAWQRATEASVTASLTALQQDTLHTLLLHRWAHRTVQSSIVWDTLRALQREGRIQRLGVSVQTPEEALEALSDEDVHFIQLPFNLLDWRWRESGVLAKLVERSDVHAAARSVYLQGVLLAAPDRWPVVDGYDSAGAVAVLERCSTELGRRNRADLCVAYCRSTPAMNSLVIGVETMAQLTETITLLNQPPLCDEDAAHVASVMPRAPEELLNPALW